MRGVLTTFCTIHHSGSVEVRPNTCILRIRSSLLPANNTVSVLVQGYYPSADTMQGQIPPTILFVP